MTDRHVFAVEVDNELHLFEQALYAERLTYDERAQFPRVLGRVRIHDAESARLMLAQRRAARAAAAT